MSNPILDYMRAAEGFMEQDNSYGRRFTYKVNGNPVAYVSFKHIWGGYKFMPYAKDLNSEVITSIDHLKAWQEKINTKQL